MRTAGIAARSYVVVHGGARDSYQVAIALEQAGMLRALVTDLCCTPTEWNALHRKLPTRWLSLVRARLVPFARAQVQACWVSGTVAVVAERIRRVPFALRRWVRRRCDAELGDAAGTLARRNGVGLLAYSYFASSAFAAYGASALLFQVHPHPLTVRRILQEELALHPQCASSLLQEWELSLPAEDLSCLIQESQTAEAYLVASSFTRESLVEHGVDPERITVVPYGVDLKRFHPAATRAPGGKLKLLFVGRMNQRKGLAYLLQALDHLHDVDLHLTVCGRVVDDLKIFEPYAKRITIRPSVSEAELLDAYQQADLFVFPSVAEGFGQVLLEALACGLPILSTTSTAAPDLIQDGVQGWIVAPRDVRALAACIRQAACDPEALRTMRTEARRRAEQFSWERFRYAVIAFLKAHEAKQNSACDDDTAWLRA